MAKDFKPRYATKTFAISPIFSFHNPGCSWSIIDNHSKSPEKTGSIKPFSQIPTINTMQELTHKLQKIWQDDNGFSCQPKVVVIEKPVSNVAVNVEHILNLTMLVGMLINKLEPELILLPNIAEWKITNKEQSEIVFKNINHTLRQVSPLEKNNMLHAINLGLYGCKVFNEEIPLPKMYEQKKNSSFFN